MCQTPVSDSFTSCKWSKFHSTFVGRSRNPQETASNDIQRNGVPPRSRSRFDWFPPPLFVQSQMIDTSEIIIDVYLHIWMCSREPDFFDTRRGVYTNFLNLRFILWLINQHSLKAEWVGYLRGCSGVVLQTPPCTYSGRNLTRRSSKASAWRKKQTWLAESVKGRLLPRITPTEETVSLRQ